MPIESAIDFTPGAVYLVGLGLLLAPAIIGICLFFASQTILGAIFAGVTFGWIQSLFFEYLPRLIFALCAIASITETVGATYSFTTFVAWHVVGTGVLALTNLFGLRDEIAFHFGYVNSQRETAIVIGIGAAVLALSYASFMSFFWVYLIGVGIYSYLRNEVFI